MIFEEKFNKLIAIPKREWEEICVPSRLKASSLWKDVKDIPSGIVKSLPSWVDWTFVVRGALRRLFGSPLFIEPLTDEEALVADSVLDRMDFKLPSSQDLLAKKKAALKAKKEAAAKAAKAAQGSAPEPLPVLESSPEPPPVVAPTPQVEPPVEVATSSPKPTEPSKKKRKVVEKGKKKVLANRSKKSKIASPASESEPQTSKDGLKRVELNLPSDVSFLNDREAGVMFMRQSLTDADEEQLQDGDIHHRFDDLLWNSLKVIIY